MSSLVNRFKSGASKAAFEADKLRRVQVAQLSIRPLRSDASRLYVEMGELAYQLYTQGEISQPELGAMGERLVEVHTQIGAIEAEIERIRAEEYVEPPPVEKPRFDLTCPNGHGALAEGTSYCQVCGAAGLSPVPVPAPIATIPCRQCGNDVNVNMRFCPTCGAVVERCANCGAVLLAGSLHCSECGTPTGGSLAVEQPQGEQEDAAEGESPGEPGQND